MNDSFDGFNTTAFDIIKEEFDVCPYKTVECVEIHFDTLEQSISIVLIIFNIAAVILVIYWLRLLWKAQYDRKLRTAVRVRRPVYIILSYASVCPWIIEEGFANIYLFWSEAQARNGQRSQWNMDGYPVYFNSQIDMITHFGFWFGFWSFFQLKIFKLWMLRYDYEYSNELNNMEWKEHLGLRTVQEASFFIRYRGWLGNAFLMFFLHLVILVTIIFIQAFIRLLIGQILWTQPNQAINAVVYEQYWIMFIGIIEVLFVIWLINKIRYVEDNFILKPESNRLFVTVVGGGIIYGLGLFVWQFSTDPPRFIYQRLGTNVTFTLNVLVFCYWETIWVLRRLRKEEAHARTVNRAIRRNQKTGINLRLADVLSQKDGFEAMMRYLVKEFSCENLLCYVELSQYLAQWKPDSNNNANAQKPAVQQSAVEYQPMTEPSVTVEPHSGLSAPSDVSMNFGRPSVDKFPYFEDPEFADELGHYEYIMQKYIYDSACLQINISHSLRHRAVTQSPGQSSDDLYVMIDDIRNDLWRLMGDSFTRFRTTTDYSKLCQHSSHKRSLSPMANKNSNHNNNSNTSHRTLPVAGVLDSNNNHNHNHNHNNAPAPKRDKSTEHMFDNAGNNTFDHQHIVQHKSTDLDVMDDHNHNHNNPMLDEDHHRNQNNNNNNNDDDNNNNNMTLLQQKQYELQQQIQEQIEIERQIQQQREQEQMMNAGNNDESNNNNSNYGYNLGSNHNGMQVVNDFSPVNSLNANEFIHPPQSFNKMPSDSYAGNNEQGSHATHIQMSMNQYQNNYQHQNY